MLYSVRVNLKHPIISFISQYFYSSILGKAHSAEKNIRYAPCSMRFAVFKIRIGRMIFDENKYYIIDLNKYIY
jgi:hypothetical protein